MGWSTPSFFTHGQTAGNLLHDWHLLYQHHCARNICCFPNKKPWVTSAVKLLLNLKRKAFKNFKALKLAKEIYVNKVEKLHENNTREIWDDMKPITDCKKNKKDNCVIVEDVVRGSEFNQFFNKFDCSTPLLSVLLLPPLPLNYCLRRCSQEPPWPHHYSITCQKKTEETFYIFSVSPLPFYLFFNWDT